MSNSNYTRLVISTQPNFSGNEAQNIDPLSLSNKVPKIAVSSNSLGNWLEEKTVITHLEVHKKDVRVKRKRIDKDCNKNVTRRAKICMFSRKQLLSLKSLIRNTDVNFNSFLTLTYPTDYPTNGKAVKLHREKLLKRLGRQYDKFGYLWVLEWQARGAPHIHIGTSIDLFKAGEVGIKWRQNKAGNLVSYRTCHESEAALFEAWGEVVGDYGRVGFEVVDSHEGVANYLLKSLESSQKIVPTNYHHAGAFWGASRDMRDKPQIIEPSGKVLAVVNSLSRVVKKGYIPTTLYDASEPIKASLDTLF